MNIPNNYREQFSNFLTEGLNRVAVFMYQTKGLPIDLFFEETKCLKSAGDQMTFLENFFRKYPRVFDGMPRFKP